MADGSIENPTVPVSAANFLEFFGLGANGTATGIRVTVENALSVPAVWCAVNLIAGEMADLPVHVYRKAGGSREKVSSPLATMLHDAVNDETSSFAWRKQMFEQVLTGGRHVTFIEWSADGRRVLNLWPLDPTRLTIRRKEGRKEYVYRDGREVSYSAAEVIDIAYMLREDGVRHWSPVLKCADAISLSIAATRYGGRFYSNGGVPPFAVTGPFQSPGAMGRAADDLADAVKKASKEQRLALVLPPNLEIKPLGADPKTSNYVEMQRFVIEEIARIYQLPPVFLQDLTHGTYSNTEQQDLHLTKHTIKRWVKQFEQELNLKLFGRYNNKQYVEMNMDALMRGDFKSRMDGYAIGIQNAIMKPNEARSRENLPDDPEGDRLLIQGATVPLGSQPQPAAAAGGSNAG